MIPVVTPSEMAGVDAAAPEPEAVLIGRAGAAVATAAIRMLGGTYGRRILVLAGRGNNGGDGRAAAAILSARGARVVVAPPEGPVPVGTDLVIDAAYGTGLRRGYTPPTLPAGTPVLAVDIPSGISGLDGSLVGDALEATASVTFAALKPGLLLGAGPAHTGPVTLAGIGLADLAGAAASAWLVDDGDAAILPARPAGGHKWQTALGVVAGSPGMTGAAWTVSQAAMRAGAGYALLGVPGVAPGDAGLPPSEIVGVDLSDSWSAPLSRCRALVVGPGLGASRDGVPGLLAGLDLPAVVDADGFNALGRWAAVAAITAGRSAPLVLTPHEGEWARLAGGPPGADRLAAVRDAARVSGAVVLLKGSVTVIAAPDGRALLAGAGSPRLATAGTGDALSGVIGAFLARGLDPLVAAGLGAHVHGRAAGLGRPEGLVASDLPELVADWLSGQRGGVGAAVSVRVV